MSLAEAEAPQVQPKERLFGELTLADLAKDEMLARTVMRIVRDACKKKPAGLTVEQVALGLREGKLRLWGVISKEDTSLEAIAVTEVSEDVFHIRVIGPEFMGSFDEFLPLFDNLARAARCQRLEFGGPGIFRNYFKRHGWNYREIIETRYEKLVEPAR